MFSGYGIYHDGFMFGLVAGDTLYLKGTLKTLTTLRRRGSKNLSTETAKG